MHKACLAIATLTLIGTRCGRNIETQEKPTAIFPIQTAIQNTAICLWPDSRLLELPNEYSVEIATLSIGERLILVRDMNLSDDLHANFTHVKLNDSTSGWVHSEILAIEATGAAVKNFAKIFSDPDPDSWTGRTFVPIDFVGVKRRTYSGWIEVIGRQGLDSFATSGWLKQTDVSEEEIDVIFSKDYKRAMQIEDLHMRINELEKILCKSGYSNSIFYTYLSGQIWMDI